MKVEDIRMTLDENVEVELALNSPDFCKADEDISQQRIPIPERG
jgi:hypothetical protein